MKNFEEQKFNIGELKGISAQNIEEHLKLYAGYVNHTNLVLAKIEELTKTPDVKGSQTSGVESIMDILSGLQKRLGFEYNGIRNHEIYFNSLSSGAHILSNESKLKNKIIEDFGSFDSWLQYFKAIATTRGVGWAMLYFDRKENRLLTTWVDEQHLGQLNSCEMILALDMWEHAFVYDYQPSGKKQYVEDFFENLNWEVVEENFIKVQ